MKKIVLFFLFIISIFSFASEKSAEEIMDELREKVAKREELKLHEEEVKKQEKIENEKEAMKLLKEKRRQIIFSPG